jgi:hypothetical protein
MIIVVSSMFFNVFSRKKNNMAITNDQISIIVNYLFPNYNTFDHHDNGDQVVVNVVEEDDFVEFFFKFIIYKDPLRITINDKKISSARVKKIKQLLQ